MAQPQDTLHGGSFNDADGADTMVAEMRAALLTARTEAGITTPLPQGTNANDMNILFAAIARGILKHLSKHPKAVQVNVQGASLSIDGFGTEIDVSDK